MTFYGVDLSHHNTITSYTELVTATDFIILKASEYRSDPTFADRKKALKGSTVLGAYHFANPDASPVDQANLFLSVAGYDMDLYALDLEIPMQNPGQFASLFLRQLKENLRQSGSSAPVMFYTYSAYLRAHSVPFDLTYYPLWIADYTGRVPYMKPWTSAQIRQTTSTGSIPGVLGHVDFDVWNTESMKTESKGNDMNMSDAIAVRDALHTPPDRSITVETWMQELYNRISTIERNVAAIQASIQPKS